MLGRNQFALRKGFAKGKTLYALRAPHPYGWVPIAGSYLTDHAVGINSRSSWASSASYMGAASV